MIKKLIVVLTVLVTILGTTAVYAGNDFSLNEATKNYTVEKSYDTFLVNEPITGTLVIPENIVIKDMIVKADIDTIIIRGEVGNISKSKFGKSIDLIIIEGDNSSHIPRNKADNVIYKEQNYATYKDLIISWVGCIIIGCVLSFFFRPVLGCIGELIDLFE